MILMKMTMSKIKWTIEKIRELPEDNWFGIKRIGEHAWQIGTTKTTMITGDGGVLQYVITFELMIKQIHEEFKKKWNG